MHYIKTRTAGIVLVFGIFFTLSCATLSPDKQSAQQFYEDGSYQKALAALDSEINNNQENFELRLLKAKVLKDFAIQEHQPELREQIYQNLRNTVDEIRFDTNDYTTTTDSILVSAWSYEQGEGVRFLQQDSTASFDDYFDRIIAHFQNAITIIPDSLVTYNLKSTTHYQHGELDEAIETLNQIEENGFTPSDKTIEKLAYLNLETGQIDRSIELYEQITEQNPDSEMYTYGLANAYILGEYHQKSIQILESLGEQYPNRVQYHEALATERFFLLQKEVDSLIAEEQNATPDDEEINIIVESINDISEIYNNISSTLPNSEESQLRVANFFTQSAEILENLARYKDEEDSGELNEKIEHQLENSIPYWKGLYEINTENMTYARKLKEIYEQLDMTHEAESLERQINF